MPSSRETVIESLAGSRVSKHKDRKLKAKDVDTLRMQLAHIAAKPKTTLFPQGERHGHLALILSDDQYGEKINDVDFELDLYRPEDMEAYDPEIDENMEDHERRIREAKWTTKMADVSKYQGVCEVLVNLIVGAVDQHYIKELEDEYTGFDDCMPRQLLDHITRKVKKTITATERSKMKKEIHVDWDQTLDFASYIVELEKIRRRLSNWSIEVSDEDMIDVAIEQVNQAAIFTREHKKIWDRMELEDRTWEEFKTHFIECYDEEANYEEETTGRGGLQGINAMQEDTDSTEMADYLFNLQQAATNNTESIQQVSTKLSVVEELTARIKSLTETVAAQQKTINSQQHTISTQQTTIAKLAGGGRGTTPGGGGGTNNSTNDGKRKQKSKCKNCGKTVMHKAEDCLELPANEAKRFDGWKSTFDGMVNPHYPSRN